MGHSITPRDSIFEKLQLPAQTLENIVETENHLGSAENYCSAVRKHILIFLFFMILSPDRIVFKVSY